MTKIGAKQVSMRDEIRIPKGVRSLFTPAHTMVLAVVYLGCRADLCKLTVTQIAQHAGITISKVRGAILLAAEVGILDVIVDHEGWPTVIKNVAIKASGRVLIDRKATGGVNKFEAEGLGPAD